MNQCTEKHYNIHLKIKSPNDTLVLSVSYWAESLGDASRKAEADYPGALFDDGWILNGRNREMHNAVDHEFIKRILTEDYGVEWGLKEALNSLPSSKDLTLSEESIQRIVHMVDEETEMTKIYATLPVYASATFYIEKPENWDEMTPAEQTVFFLNERQPKGYLCHRCAFHTETDYEVDEMNLGIPTLDFFE